MGWIMKICFTVSILNISTCNSKAELVTLRASPPAAARAWSVSQLRASVDIDEVSGRNMAPVHYYNTTLTFHHSDTGHVVIFK